MKKFFAIFLALILAAAVIVGCGETGVSNPTPDGEVSELYEQVMSRFTGELEKGAVVKVLENDTAIEIGYVDKLIEAFNEAYKDKGISAERMNIDQYSEIGRASCRERV